MNSQDEDHGLREAFALQRREEEKQVTKFHRLLTLARTLSQGRGRTSLVPVILAASVLVALGLVIGQVLQHSEPVAPPGTGPTAYLAGWTEPTAFLLRTPGYDFVSTLPAFGRAVPALDPGAPPLPLHTPTQQERS